MASILMPKATAVWLIDNTSLTFEQIAEFCELHTLEVKGIADGDVASGVRGADPINTGQLTRDEIDKAQADPNYRMKPANSDEIEAIRQKSRKGTRYTPISRRGDRPDAIAWLIKYHPEISDAQIGKLIGTTKSTISAVRERNHWNAQHIRPQDPVSLGLCTQIALDEIVEKHAKKRAELEESEAGDSLRSVTEALSAESVEEDHHAPTDNLQELNADQVFKSST